MFKKILFNLQLFDSEIDDMNRTSDAGMTDEMKEFYNTALLENALPNLVFQQFGLKQKLPQNTGLVVEWRKFGGLHKATTPLEEGVTPKGHKVSVSHVKAQAYQYGDFTMVSDLLDMTAVDNTIAEITKLHAQNAALTVDTLTRNELLASTNVLFAPTSGGTPVLQREDLDETCILTPSTVAKVAAILKRKNAPKIDGSYVMVVHPDVELDLLANETKWIDLQKYTDNVSKVFNGEIGSLYGIRFVRSTEAPILAPTEEEREGAGANKLAVFPCLAFGDKAYGVVNLTGGEMEIIVKQRGSGGTADPLNQRSSVGWKLSGYAAKILNNDYMVSCECIASEFSRTEVSNDTPAVDDLPEFED